MLSALTGMLGTMKPTQHEWRLESDGEVRITTPASTWLIRPNTYARFTRHTEQPRSVPSDALTDGDWHEHVGARWFIDPTTNSCTSASFPPAVPTVPTASTPGLQRRSKPSRLAYGHDVRSPGRLDD